MKKSLAVLLSLLMILCLCGCNKGDKPVDNPTDNPTDTPTDDTFDEEELLQILEDNSRFIETNQRFHISFGRSPRFYEEMIKNSGYFLKADITAIEKLEDGRYQFTMHVPAFEGNEMTDPYDAYDFFYTISYDYNNPKEFDCTAESADRSNSTVFHFESDKGLSEDELLKQLEANSDFFCDTLSTISWFNAAEKTYEETKEATSYFFKARITGFRYLLSNEYELTLHVDGFEGSEDTDPYDPYDVIMNLTYDPANPKEYNVYTYNPDNDYYSYGLFTSMN